MQSVRVLSQEYFIYKNFHDMMNSEESETGLTASILKKDPKTHLRLKRTLFDQA